MKISPFFMCFAFFLSFSAAIHGVAAQNLIRSTCRTSAGSDPNIDYNFCTTSLLAAPASRCAALKGLGTISIRLIRYNVTDTRCHVKRLLMNQRWDPYVRQCLSDCFELFSDAIPTVKQAMRYYNAKRFDDANVQISAIMEAANTCEDGFKDKDGVVSPLTKRNGDTFRLSAVALSLLKLIQAQPAS